MRVPSLLLALAACGGPTPEPLLDPDPARDGADGADGPHGALAVDFRAQARVTERVWVEAIVPFDGDAPLPDAPVVVFVQGGFVDVSRYRWLGAHLASRGYATLLPWHALDLALPQVGNAAAALAAAADSPPDPLDGAFDTSRRAIGGHSLGGVTAAVNFVDDPAWDGLFLAASFPAAGTPVEGDARPALSLIGSDDGAADAAATADGAARFDGPVFFGVVDGLNHYGWTDDPTARELRGDGRASRPVEDARRDALRVLDAWLDATLRDDPVARAALDGEFPNVERP